MWRLNYVPTLFLIYKLAVGTCSKFFNESPNLFTEKVLRSLLCNFPQVQNHVPKTYVYITLQTYSDIIHTKLNYNEHMCPSPVGPRNCFFAFFKIQRSTCSIRKSRPFWIHKYSYTTFSWCQLLLYPYLISTLETEIHGPEPVGPRTGLGPGKMNFSDRSRIKKNSRNSD